MTYPVWQHIHKKPHPIVAVKSSIMKFNFLERKRGKEGNCYTCKFKKDGKTCKSFSAQKLCSEGRFGYFWHNMDKIE